MNPQGDTEPVTPFLRWAGSKRQQLPFLKQLLPLHFRRYVEPFAGSASLFFATQPSAALLGDLNHDLICTYRVVAQRPAPVHRALALLPPGRDAYYKIRDEWRPKSPAERAAKFIYLNRFCFNGLYRTNSSGAFNVPYGRPKNSNVPSLTQLQACSRLLRRAELISGDFREVLASVEARDFVYLDPPYAVRSRRVFTEYGKKTFDVDDLSELADELIRLNKLGAGFVLSYADSAEARALFKQWLRRKVRVRRNVAGFSASRRHQYELYVSNVQTEFFVS